VNKVKNHASLHYNDIAGLQPNGANQATQLKNVYLSFLLMGVVHNDHEAHIIHKICS
jgi:hypothetical protein